MIRLALHRDRGRDAADWVLQRLTQADVAAFVAERLARGLGIDTAARMPRLRELTKRLAEHDAFRSTEPE